LGRCSRLFRGALRGDLALGWLWLGWPRRVEHDRRRSTALAVLRRHCARGVVRLASAPLCAPRNFLAKQHVEAGGNIRQPVRKIAIISATPSCRIFCEGSTRVHPQRSAGDWRTGFFQCTSSICRSPADASRGSRLLVEFARPRAPTPARWGFLGRVCRGRRGVARDTGARDEWASRTSACKPLVLLALALLAARWRALGRAWRLALVAGATLDSRSHRLPSRRKLRVRPLAPRQPRSHVHSYPSGPSMNLAGKYPQQLAFFLRRARGAVAAVLIALALFSARAASRAQA